MTAAYYDDGTVQLWLGDSREVLPALGITADLVVADPPYAETSLAWDRWPDGWLDIAALVTSSLWCFGSMRMFLDRRDEFAAWRLSQDVVWEKHNGSGFATDRFKRVHEVVTHWYRGGWAGAYHQVPVTLDATARTVKRRGPTPHTGKIGDRVSYETVDGGPRLMRSVIYGRSMNHNAIHPTEKPVGILTPLIEYGCPPDGLVIDPFSGSSSTLEAARLSGRRAIGIEAHEPYAEAAAKRLANAPLELT